MFFYGHYHHTLDDKGRLTIPARYRDWLAAQGAIVMQGLDKNLMVFPAPAYEAASRQVNAMNPLDPNARLMKRLFFGTAYDIEVDKVGRILIPSPLRDAAGLQDSVVVVGNGSYFEVWAADLWNNELDRIADVEANTERFSPFQLLLG